MSKRIFTATIAVIAVSLAGVFFGGVNSTASALSGSSFDAGRIIDDVVFYNNGSMSSSQIQSFLNSKVPACDTNGTQSAADWGYPSITHAQLAQYKREGSHGFSKDTGFHAPPYTCLKDYSQDTPQMEAASGLCSGLSAKSDRTSAQIIKDVANACGINPQVLLVLLNKEQSLVTDTWPLQRQYNNATGFACPDTAPCDPAYKGFFYQVFNAARQFKVYQAYPDNYNYIAGRTNKIYWQTNLGNWKNNSGNYNSSYGSCGYSNVYIENQATAGLYIYTPYRPNQKALANLYGTGDSCSAYGNRNFWRMFTDWFGSTKSGGEGAIYNRYMTLGGETGKLGAPTKDVRCGLVNGGCYQNFENGAILWTKSTGAWESTGSIRSYWITTGWEGGSLGYPTGPEESVPTGGYQQSYERGIIIGKYSSGYWMSRGSIRDRWLKTGGTSGSLGYPTGPETALPTGGWRQTFENGVILGQYATGYWDSSSDILAYYLSLGGPASKMGYPVKEMRCGLVEDGCYQNFQHGAILWTEATGAWESTGSIRARWTQTGWEGGSLGYPTGPETAIPTGGWKQTFQHGTIQGKPATGYWDSSSAILSYYQSLGGPSSKLGYPTKEMRCGLVNNGCYQNFQHGAILWTAATGAWESTGTIRARWITTGWEGGSLGYPTGPEVKDETGTWSQTFEKGTINAKQGVSTVEYSD